MTTAKSSGAAAPPAPVVVSGWLSMGLSRPRTSAPSTAPRHPSLALPPASRLGTPRSNRPHQAPGDLPCGGGLPWPSGLGAQLRQRRRQVAAVDDAHRV